MAKVKRSAAAAQKIDELPPTMPIPQAGALFFGASSPASYRLARAGVIPTVETGSRNKLALPRVLAQRLSRDPRDTASSD